MLIETLEFDDDIFAAGRYKSFSLYFCCEIENDTSYKVNKCFLDSENGLCLEKQIKRENQIKHLKEINVKLILSVLLFSSNELTVRTFYWFSNMFYKMCIWTWFQGTATTPGSTGPTRFIVRMPTDCLMGPSLPRTWPLNTTTLEIAPSGFTMPGEKLKKLLIRILPSIEVSEVTQCTVTLCWVMQLNNSDITLSWDGSTGEKRNWKCSCYNVWIEIIRFWAGLAKWLCDVSSSVFIISSSLLFFYVI